MDMNSSKMLRFLSLLSVVHISSSLSSSNCSALNAFVESRSSQPGGNLTYLSSQALFPPYSYEVPWTDLVVLSTDDDICDFNANLSIDITDTIVLLFESIGNCSAQLKVYVAEVNGAVAVLMANNLDSGLVHNIVDDNTLSDEGISTLIPMRGITKGDGQILHEDLSADIAIGIKIGCFEDPSYPSVLCVSDYADDIDLPLKGEYQRQVSTYNDHPIWRLEGYVYETHPLYLFLHDADGDDDWFWAIGETDDFDRDSYMALRCIIGGNNITDPSKCPLWASWETAKNQSQIQISDDLCVDAYANASTATVCVSSSKYSIAGIKGTYVFSWYGDYSNMGDFEWFRVLSECDSKPGIIVFRDSADEGTFTIYDIYRGDSKIAYCALNKSFVINGSYAHLKLRLDLCTEWYVKPDDDLAYPPEYEETDTISITTGECAADTTLPCIASDAPDIICMANNSEYHNSFMGEYIRSNQTGPIFNSPMYVRKPPADAPWVNFSMYIWYSNEYYLTYWGTTGDNIHTRQWIVSPKDLDYALARAESGRSMTAYMYGYGFGYAYGNPVDCQSWAFNAKVYRQYDEYLTLTEGTCDDNFWPEMPSTWPEYVCIALKNDSLTLGHPDSIISASVYIGAYHLNTTGDSKGPFPLWTKSANDIEDDIMYLYMNLDYIYGPQWEITTVPYGSSYYVAINCDPLYRWKSLNPVDCVRWVDNSKEGMDDIYLYECDASDVLTISPTADTASPTVDTLAPTSAPTQQPTMDCTAFNAFVEARSSSSQSTVNNYTFLSSQALFPPYDYEVQWTDLTVLSYDDDICDINATLSVDITDTIVLLFETIGNCSAHFKVYSAQMRGAVAVLIANDLDSGVVVSVVDDNTISDQNNTVIPMRSITKTDGNILYDEVTAGFGIEIKIACFEDASFPSVLCVSADSAYVGKSVAGEYQRQADFEYNQHPTWVLEGYSYWTDHLYMYLHDAYGDDEWYWAIGWGEATSWVGEYFATDLLCTVGGSDISDPTLCPLWAYWNDTHAIEKPDINITGNLCPEVKNMTFCVQSSDHQLGGLLGTYSLGSYGDAEWYRDLTECDQRAGVMWCHGNFTGINVNWGRYWYYAYCYFNETQAINGSYEHLQYRPDLCEYWFVNPDDDFSFQHTPDWEFAGTLVTLGECENTPASCTPSEAPDSFCVANHSMFQNRLVGTYVKMNKTGPLFDSPIYKRQLPDSASWINQSTYIWYRKEYYLAYSGDTENHHMEQWTISTYDLEGAWEITDSGGTPYSIGFGFGYAYGNPVDTVTWVTVSDNTWQADETLTITAGDCPDDFFPEIPTSWPEYLCIRLNNDSWDRGHPSSELSASVYIGAYQLNTSMDVDGPFPFWTKIYNDLEDNNMRLYMYMDYVYGPQWAVQYQGGSSVIHCDWMYKWKSLNPMDCVRWFDVDKEIMDITLYECSASDVWTASPTSPTLNPTPSPTAVPKICLSRAAGASSLLEGVYVSLADTNTGDNVVFESTNVNLDDPIYLWHHDNKWFISPQQYNSSTMQLASVNVYGYCPGGVFGCDDNWIFYWDLENKDKYVEDATFSLSLDVSMCEQYSYDIEDETFCINDISDDNEDSDSDDGASYVYEDVEDVAVDLESLFGLYNRDSLDILPAYIHDNAWMKLDVMTNHWLIGFTSSDKAQLLCYGIPQPEQCVAWDEAKQMSISVDHLISVTVQCNKKKGKAKQTGDGRIVAGVVFGVVLGIICCVVIIVVFCKDRKTKGRYQLETEDAIQHETELATSPNSDGATLTAHAVGTHQIQQTFDMADLDARDENDVDPLQ